MILKTQLLSDPKTYIFEYVCITICRHIQILIELGFSLTYFGNALLAHVYTCTCLNACFQILSLYNKVEFMGNTLNLCVNVCGNMTYFHSSYVPLYTYQQ